MCNQWRWFREAHARGNILARNLLFEISGFFRAGCSGFSWGVPGFFWSLVFLGVFQVFLGCSGFSWGCSGLSWECSGFFGGVPGFSVVPECSVMFRCSGVPESTTCHRRPLLFIHDRHFIGFLHKQN